MEEFEKLVEQYENLHPKAESPGFWIMQFDIDVITEMLKNSNGRQISVIEKANQLDGGELIYIEN